MSHTTHENGISTWPTLYKITKGGKTQVWDITVVPLLGTGSGTGPGEEPNGPDWSSIIVKHGQDGGKIQTANQEIRQGKNLGKSNATTPLEQAVYEAEAKWLKQKDKGYSEERCGASLALKPMLAHKYEDHKAKVTFPAYLQPKLDGVRAIAHKHDGKVDLWSRQGKQHVGLNHIRSSLLEVMLDGEMWDGELYVHGMQFQKLVSLVKKDQAGSGSVKYHVYDTVSDTLSFKNRFARLDEALEANDDLSIDCHLVQRVTTLTVEYAEQVESYHQQFVEKGYEGVMLRVGDCSYLQGYRSHQLLKVKAFQEAEFKIIDVVPGVGKMVDQGIFVCVTEQGREFRATPKGRDSLREEYLTNKTKYIGKMLTVIYFSMTDGYNAVPRFPVGKAIRTYE